MSVLRSTEKYRPDTKEGLLCGACNRAKGTGTQARMIAKLKERGQLAA